MSKPVPDTFRETDDDARRLARDLVAEARYGALGVLLDNVPFVSRVALASPDGTPMTLISDLAPHTDALRKQPEASLLIGEPGKGDPLAHPRITLNVRARFIDKTEAHVSGYLSHQPKANLYIGFADFHLVRLDPLEGWLNGGFGKAFHLSAQDLRFTDA